MSLNGYRLLIYAIFIRGPWPKNYITEPSFAFLQWRRTPSRLLCECHGKSTDKVARPGLHSKASVPSHFSSLLHPEETPPRSAQGQGTLLEEATNGGCSPPPRFFRILPRSRKEKSSSYLNPSLALFRHSSAGRDADRWDAGEVISFIFMRIVKLEDARKTVNV